ncbi:tRNA methyltransferase 1 [Chamberlinius hualienensis]
MLLKKFCFRSDISYLVNGFRQILKMSSISASNTSDVDSKLSGSNGNIILDKTAYTVVEEGRASVYFPNSNDVFYNPVQEFNRDLSVACIREFVKELKEPVEDKKQFKAPKIDGGVKLLEALSASGLRSIRYAKEIPGIVNVVANDMSTQAYEAICRNAKFNDVEDIVIPNQDDAAMLMYKHRNPNNRFHVVDLDPYGSPSIFLDAAVQSVCDGGILLVTCTDMAVLCGNGSETCFSKYGAMSLKSKSCHEMALRIVLQSVESHANRYGRYVLPLISVSVDFYVRIIVKIFTSPATVKKSASKRALVYMCNGCETFTLQPLGKSVPNEKGGGYKHSPATGPTLESTCQHCGSKHKIGGPIWTDELHDTKFVEKVLKSIEDKPDDFKTAKKMQGMLSIILEELPDVPLYYVLDRMSSVCHVNCPKMMSVRSAILNANYRVSYSHAISTSIKTDAPPEFMWDIFRAWIEQSSLKKELVDGDPAKVLLSKERRHEISFEIHSDCNPESRKTGLARYPVNPEKFWGPKARAKSSLRKELPNEKSLRLQGKRKCDSQGTVDTKQFECKRFKAGKCDLGDECRYSHCIAEQSESAS